MTGFIPDEGADLVVVALVDIVALAHGAVTGTAAAPSLEEEFALGTVGWLVGVAPARSALSAACPAGRIGLGIAFPLFSLGGRGKGGAQIFAPPPLTDRAGRTLPEIDAV